MAYGISLVEFKKVVEDETIRILYDPLIRSSALFRFLTFQNINRGFDPKLNKFTGDSGIAFRALNADYSEAVQAYDTATEKIRPFGKFHKFDPTEIAQGGADLVSNTLLAYSRRMGLKFVDAFFNSSVDDDANAFDGLAVRCAADEGEREITAGVDGGVITDELINEMFDGITGDPDAVFCSVKGAGYIRQLVKLQPYKERIDFIQIEGFNRAIPTFDGIPFIPIEKNDNGDLIIPNDEEEGSSGAVCTSYYGVKLGPGFVEGLQGRARPGAQPGMYLSDMVKSEQEKFCYNHEWVAGLVVPDVEFMMRLKGVTGPETGSET